MMINGINRVNPQINQMGMNQATDSYTRNIQRQIANAQKQLQELSSKQDMSAEDKMRKRQEIQQQINDLNMQLQQHQLEQRREKQQAKAASANNTTGIVNETNGKSAGLSRAGMTAMISADTSVKQANIHSSAASSLEARARVLKGEIKYSRGGNVEKKQEELADVEQKARDAAMSQVTSLSDANKTMDDAAKADRKADNGGTEENVSNVPENEAQEEKAYGSEE